jgi:exodeoxyribonuclease VII large subunit
VGAVWDDICTVLRRRYPMAEVVLSPTAVQGGIAAPAIIRALKRLYAVRDLDLVILARGGGSIEDLWGFNDEQVVRTVVAAPMPVVVGVGHESDVTLADFAADRRAPTPSAAAEISVPDGTQLPAILNRLGERSTAAMTARLLAATRAVRGEGRALAGLKPDLAAARQRAAELLDRSHRAVTTDRERRALAVAGLRDALRALGPTATLERGYAVARRADGMIVRDPADVAAGDALEVIVSRGAVDAQVTTIRPGSMEDLLS